MGPNSPTINDLQYQNQAAVASQWRPNDSGLLSYTFDPQLAYNSSILPAGGTLYGARLHVPVQSLITNIVMVVATAGATLTNSFAGLYNSSRQLLSATASQNTPWVSTGVKTMALATPQTVQPGDYLVAFYATGTTMPTFFRSGNQQTMNNLGLSSPNMRFFSADTGLTTALPSTMGAQTALGIGWWVGLS